MQVNSPCAHLLCASGSLSTADHTPLLIFIMRNLRYREVQFDSQGNALGRQWRQQAESTSLTLGCIQKETAVWLDNWASQQNHHVIELERKSHKGTQEDRVQTSFWGEMSCEEVQARGTGAKLNKTKDNSRVTVPGEVHDAEDEERANQVGI